MKKYSLLLAGLFLILLINTATAQHTEKIPPGGCTTGMYSRADYMVDAAGFLQRALAARQAEPGINNFTTPYVIRCFIRIFRDSDGSSAACTIAEATQNFQEMNVQYAGHNICFQLMGIDYINDSYGNHMPYDTLIDTDYKAYLNTKRLSSAFTIFIHNEFVASGSSGQAYDIPNSFVSIARWATIDATVHTIFGHEVGHALGLYHTFQKQYYTNGTVKSEQVSRLSTNSCYNCQTFGDLCCDTPADYSGSDGFVNGTTCVYTGTKKDTCGPTAYAPSTINIMSYMPWQCLAFGSTGFTTDQRTRMHATINDVNGPIYSKVAPDNATFGFGFIFSSGFLINSGRNSLGSVGTNTYNGSSQFYGAVNDNGAITINPGTSFAPGSSGLAVLAVTSCN